MFVLVIMMTVCGGLMVERSSKKRRFVVGENVLIKWVCFKIFTEDVYI